MTTYLIGCFALIIKPGPDLMCTIATALSEGRVKACTLMAGLVSGCWLWVVLLTLGVASFFASHLWVMISVQLAGMCYIAYLAFMSFREAVLLWRGPGGDAMEAAKAAGLALFRRGVVMSMSNPLTILFFLAFLPSFMHDEAALPPAAQTILLGSAFCAMVPFVYLPIILAADFFRSRLIGNARFMAGLKAFSGLILVWVVALLAAGLKFPPR
ncbi:MAG: LysE family translocator [Kiritimatiellae bacterium]|nr:LysE family translocator [Kiritimatiellia bacterium]